jgi:hypothetical protein
MNVLSHLRNWKGALFALALFVSVGIGFALPNDASAYGSVLLPGESLQNWQKLESASGQFASIMQDDGNLVNYMWPHGYWASNTGGRPNARLVMQTDGNLVIYHGSVPIWASHTQNNPGAYLILQDDGNLVMRAADGRVIWSPNAVPTRLYSGQQLFGDRNWQVFSPDRRYRMVMQSDGNAVIYDGSVAIWASHTNRPGSTLEMQTDANLVVYGPGHVALWATNRTGPNNSYLQGQNDGNFVIYAPNGTPLWASKSSGNTNQQLAQRLIDMQRSGQIVIDNYSTNPTSDRNDRSLASLQLEDIARTGQANLSTRCTNKGGRTTVVPDTRVLQFLVELGQQDRYHINTLFGQCHSTNSTHYAGQSVDFSCVVDLQKADTVGARHGIWHNSETCAADGHWHYSVGGR